MNYKCGQCHQHVVDAADSEWCPHCGILYDPQGKMRLPAIGQKQLEDLCQLMGTHVSLDQGLELAYRLWEFIEEHNLQVKYYDHRRGKELELAKRQPS